MFYKIGVLKYFAKFTGIHLCRSLFFDKVYRNFFIEHLRWLLLKFACFLKEEKFGQFFSRLFAMPLCSFLKKLPRRLEGLKTIISYEVLQKFCYDFLVRQTLIESFETLKRVRIFFFKLGLGWMGLSK